MSPNVEPTSSRDNDFSSSTHSSGLQSCTSTSRPWPQSRRSFEQIEANSFPRTRSASRNSTSNSNGLSKNFSPTKKLPSSPEPCPVPASANSSSDTPYRPRPKRKTLSSSSLQSLNDLEALDAIQDPFERWESESTRDSPWNAILGIGVISPIWEQAERKNKEGRDDSSDRSSIQHTKKRPRQRAEGARRR